MYHKYEHFTDDLDDNQENMILSFENVDVEDEIVESEFKIDDEIKYGDYVTIDDFKTNNKSISKNKIKVERSREQIMKMLSKSKYIIVFVIIGLLLSILLGLLLKIKRKMKIQRAFNEVEPPRLY